MEFKVQNNLWGLSMTYQEQIYKSISLLLQFSFKLFLLQFLTGIYLQCSHDDL